MSRPKPVGALSGCPARSRQPGGSTRRPLNASPSSSISWPKRPKSRRRALTPSPPSSRPSSDSSCQYPSASMPAGLPNLLSAVVGQGPARSGHDQRADQAALAGRIVEDDALRLSARQFAQEVEDGAWPSAHHGLAQSKDL